jgi:hypothetical protein
MGRMWVRPTDISTNIHISARLPSYRSDFFTGSCALAIGKDDTVFYLFNGDDMTTAVLETRVMLSRADPASLNFSLAVDISDAPVGVNVYHGFVMLAEGPVRVYHLYMSLLYIGLALFLEYSQCMHRV